MRIAKSILVVDDDVNLRKSLVQILRSAGHEVDCAENAQRSLVLLNEHSYDVMLLDHKMPDMNGLTMLAAIHRSFPQMRVLVLTGVGTAELQREAADRGAWKFLRKPVDPEEILALIASICL
jgi:DNA-binding NtrC family response regulator